MILGVAGSDTKKIIANVVTSALLINFSLFITKILIDAGNILAVSIYNMIIVEGTISGQIGDAFDIGILFGSTGVKCVFCTPYLVASILQVLGMLITVISFGYVAMLLIVRNASLMFLMAFSPIGFMGATIPKLKEYSDKWWKNLYGQVFVAPIFLIILLLILKIAPIFDTIIKEGAMEFEGANEGLSQTVNYLPVFKFLMISILIVIAVKVTKEMSGVVGEMAGKVGSLAVGAALGAATGGAALLGRQFIGRGAAALAAKEGLINSAAQGGIRGFPAKMALRSANYASKASFDIRGTESFKKVTGFVGDQTGIKVDYTGRTNIQKGGYIATKEKKEKEMEARAKELANVDALKVDHWHDLTQDEVNAKIAERKAAAADAMNAQKKIIDDNKAKLTDTTLTAKQRAKIEKGIDDAEEKFEEEQKMKDFDTQSNEEKMRLEETIRKEMAKKQTKDAATNRLESVARNNSLANKRAASVIRGFIKANSKEKTDSDKLLEEISRNTKPPKS
jgi:hypothetical protein